MGMRVFLAGIAVFLLWAGIDWVVHGWILGGAYEATANLWRPMEEFKWVLMYITTAVAAFAFVIVYGRFVNPKSMSRALGYGLVLGIGLGAPMGYGSYAVMPIPYSMALGWFLGVLAESLIGGLVTGWIVRESEEPEEPSSAV